MACSRRAPSTARLCTARHDRLVEAQPAQPPRSQRPERARTAHAQSCSSRATACLATGSDWAVPPPGCAASLASEKPALGHTYLISAGLQPHTAHAHQPVLRVSSCCHPPPDPCRTLGQPLCARCGGDAPDQVTFGLLPCAAFCSPDPVAVAVPMCACAVATALSHSHTVGVGESGHELGNGSYDSLTKQRALRASRTSEPSPGARAALESPPAHVCTLRPAVRARPPLCVEERQRPCKPRSPFST